MASGLQRRRSLGWQHMLLMVGALALAGCSSTSSVSATATPTPLPSPTATPIGPPRLGAPLEAFGAVYGPMVHHSGSGDNWWADKDKTIRLNVTFSGGKAIAIVVFGPGSWTLAHTLNYCSTFLPPGASKVLSSGQVTAYQSDLGGVSINLISSGFCAVTLSQ